MPVDAEHLADAVAAAIQMALAPVLARVEVLERENETLRAHVKQMPSAGRDGRDGKDGRDVDETAIIARVLGAIPPPVVGPPGDPGRDGADGHSLFTGHGPPVVVVGKNGDVYLDASTGDVFVCR
jgi:hypothetical protein